MMAGDTPEEAFGQLLAVGKAWGVLGARLEANSSRFVLKVEDTPDLWPELQSATANVSCVSSGDASIPSTRSSGLSARCLGLPRGWPQGVPGHLALGKGTVSTLLRSLRPSSCP